MHPIHGPFPSLLLFWDRIVFGIPTVCIAPEYIPIHPLPSAMVQLPQNLLNAFLPFLHTVPYVYLVLLLAVADSSDLDREIEEHY
jgi:hypothetical protein